MWYVVCGEPRGGQDVNVSVTLIHVHKFLV